MSIIVRKTGIVNVGELTQLTLGKHNLWEKIGVGKWKTACRLTTSIQCPVGITPLCFVKAIEKFIWDWESMNLFGSKLIYLYIS